MSPAGRLRHRAAALAAALVLATALAAASDCERVVAVGDLHGGIEDLETILKETGLTDDAGEWIGGDACLVQLGDMVDRGPSSRAVLDRLMALATARPEQVFVLLGNHEVMTLVGDLRDTHPGEFAAFAAEETEAERDAAFERWRSGTRDEFRQRFPPGWFARRRAFAPDGRYGSWLLSLPVVQRLDDSVFVHGGLEPNQARVPPSTLARRIRREVTEFLRLRDALEAAGVIVPFASFEDVFLQADSWLYELRKAAAEDEGEGEVEDSGPEEETAGVVETLLRLRNGLFIAPEGPLWNRALANGAEADLVGPVGEILDTFDVERIVVGHSPRESHRIESRLDGRVFLTDTGAGPERPGTVSALEIDASGVRARYPGGEPETLATPPMPDDAVERMLAEGTVISMEDIGVGITKPQRVTLELDGRTMRAAFKTINQHETGMIRFQSGVEMNFTDDYRYERAAYLLDRMLGLYMVPPAVIRKLDGREGALIAWVENAVNERDRAERRLRPENPLRLIYQRATMELFDALILNDDRNLANQLYTPADGRLHLIDHSRSFRTDKDLPERYLSQPASLTPQLQDTLRSLELETLRERLGDLLSRAQTKALIARRDKILAKIEADAKRYGEAMVFQDPSALPPAPR